jgi:hypothetical protein
MSPTLEAQEGGGADELTGSTHSRAARLVQRTTEG